jgi:hypothetical protein
MTIDQKTFQEFIDKRFNLGDKVFVHSLGPSMSGEYPATVVGIYSFEPYEMYIIAWDNIEAINKFYKSEKKWTHCVMAKGCMRLVEHKIA